MRAHYWANCFNAHCVPDPAAAIELTARPFSPTAPSPPAVRFAGDGMVPKPSAARRFRVATVRATRSGARASSSLFRVVLPGRRRARADFLRITSRAPSCAINWVFTLEANSISFDSPAAREVVVVGRCLRCGGVDGRVGHDSPLVVLNTRG
jgi:hypothetical protein